MRIPYIVHRTRRTSPAGLVLATLLLTLTNAPGVLAATSPQFYARPGPGVSNLPLGVTAFFDPSYGEIGDALNVATGGVYYQADALNWNNLTAAGMAPTTASPPPNTGGGTGGGGTGGGGGTTDPPEQPGDPSVPAVMSTGPSTSKDNTKYSSPSSPTSTTSSASFTSTSTTSASTVQTRTTGLLRLQGFQTAPGSFVPYEYGMEVGDGGWQYYRRATTAEVTTAPSWIKERYAGLGSGVIYFISKPQAGVQIDETWLVSYQLGNSRMIAHYYDHVGNRTTFYNDGEYADYQQSLYEQYRGAKNYSDAEGINSGTPKTEFAYTQPGNGHLSTVADSWGRVTKYSWDEAIGVVTAVYSSLRTASDVNTAARKTEYSYGIYGGQRVITSVTFRTGDGRGGNSTRTYNLRYKIAVNNQVLLEAVSKPVVGTATRTTTYEYDDWNRVSKITTPGQPTMTLTYGPAPLNTDSGGLEVRQQQGNKAVIYQFTPEGWLRNVLERKYNPATSEDANPITHIGAGLVTKTKYDSSGRVIDQILPGGRQIQTTYDIHGNPKTVSIYKTSTAWNSVPPTGYIRQTSYIYNSDNQIENITLRGSGTQGVAGDTSASDAPFSYSNQVNDTSYGSSTAFFGSQSFKIINSVTDSSKINTIEFQKSVSNIDEYGRIKDMTRTASGSTEKKITSYLYFSGATTYNKIYPTTISSNTPDGQSSPIPQYGDLIQKIIVNGVVTGFDYDELGNVVRSYTNAATISKWTGDTQETVSDYRFYSYNGFGQLVWEMQRDYKADNTYTDNYIAQNIYYQTGEIDASWTGTSENSTDYIYVNVSETPNVGRVSSVSEGIAGGTAGGVTTTHKKTNFAYDDFGRVASTSVDPNADQITYTRAGGFVKGAPAEGFVTRYQYDTQDRLVSTQQPDGSKLVLSYNGDGTLASEDVTHVDGKTMKVTHVVDSLGREYQTIYPTGTVTTYYDPFDRPIKITDGRLTMNSEIADKSTYYRYDSVGRLIKRLDPMLVSVNSGAYVDSRRPYTEWSYDNFGRMTEQRVLLSGATLTSSVIDTDASSLTAAAVVAKTKITAFDLNDRPVTIEDAAGYKTTLTYDASGRTTRAVKDVLTAADSFATRLQLGYSSITTRTAYDSLGRVTQVIDAVGNTKTMSYGFFGLTSETDESGTEIKRYAYTADGLLQSVQEPDIVSGSGWTTTSYYVYDSRQFPSRRYQASMNQAAGSGSGAQTSYVYNAYGQATETTLPPDGSGVSPKLYQAYHDNGRVLASKDGNGFVYRYEYDQFGRLTGEYKDSRGTSTDIDAGLSNGLSSSYAYTPAGQVSRRVSKGLITEYQYNSLGQVIRESRPRAGDTAAAQWKLTTYRLDGRPTATTSYDYAGSLASQPDVAQFASNPPSVTAGNLTISVYNARGELTARQSRGTGRDTSGNPTPLRTEYTLKQFVDGLGRPYQRDFEGNTEIYALQRDNSGLSLGHANVTTYWTYDRNGNLLRKSDMPTGNGDVTSNFTYTYTATNREKTSSRLINVRVRAGTHSNELLIQGGSEGILLTGSAATTSNTYNARGLLTQHVASEQSPTPTPQGNACSYDCRGQSLPRRHSDFGTPITRTTNYTYFNDGRRLTNTVVETGAVRRVEAYDGIGREVRVSDSNGPAQYGNNLQPNTATTIVTTYTPGQQKVEYQQGGATKYTTTTLLTVDGMSASQVESGTSTVNHSFRYSDSLGLIVQSKTWTNSSDMITKTFGYDEYGQQLSVTTTTGNATDVSSMTYDTNGTQLSAVLVNPVRVENYAVDSRGNRLELGGNNPNAGFQKRYTPEDQVSTYHKVGVPGFCGIMGLGCQSNGISNRYNNFVYDPFGQQVVTGTSEIQEGGNDEYKIFRVLRSTTVVDGEAQVIFGRGNGSSSLYFHWKEGAPRYNSGMTDSYTPLGYVIKDQSYSAADGLNDTNEWNGTRIFSTPPRSVTQLDAPIESLSTTLNINPLDLTDPEIPNLPNPGNLNFNVDTQNQLQSPASIEPQPNTSINAPKRIDQDESLVRPFMIDSRCQCDLPTPPTSLDERADIDQQAPSSPTGEINPSEDSERDSHPTWADRQVADNRTYNPLLVQIVDRINDIRIRNGDSPVHYDDYIVTVDESYSRVEDTAKSILGNDYVMPDVTPREAGELVEFNYAMRVVWNEPAAMLTNDLYEDAKQAGVNLQPNINPSLTGSATPDMLTQNRATPQSGYMFRGREFVKGSTDGYPGFNPSYPAGRSGFNVPSRFGGYYPASGNRPAFALYPAGVTRYTTAIGPMSALSKYNLVPSVDTWWKTGPRISNTVTWKENKAWLDTRIARGDKFLMTVNPDSLPREYTPNNPNSWGYFTYLEYKHLVRSGATIIKGW